MPHVVWFTVLTHALVAVIVSPPPVAAAMAPLSRLTTSPSPQPPARCANNRNCGGVDIPYPFAVDDANCSFQGMQDFTITCNHTYSPPRPYWNDIEIVNISVVTGEMVVYTPVSYICYSSPNTIEFEHAAAWTINVSDTPFLFSPTGNVFTAIGCNTLALLSSSSYLTGCITYCPSAEEAAGNGDPCTGLGCCQTSIPSKLDTISVNWDNVTVTSTDNSTWNSSLRCSYGFVAAKGWYDFKQQDLITEGNQSFISRAGDRSIPIVLDWAFLDGSCQNGTGGGEATAPACGSANSYCVNTTNGNGYLCKCTNGYQGNPYITDGCTDVNECNGENSCGPYSSCENTEGDYNCKCSINHKGVGKSKDGCHRYYIHPYAIAAVAIFVAAVLASLAIILLQKRNQRKLFSKNGGDILDRMGIKIFTKAELDNITDSYSKRIGKGNFGEVFKGTATIDGAHAQQVAVKRTVGKKEAQRKQKSLRPKATQQEQEKSWKDGFVDEITFQFKIRHTNVVRLVGCCLETDIPILVFKFVGKGSLDDELHVRRSTLSLLQRLEIAIGSAEGLSHMHCAEHVHGDVKPANILLDDDLNPKVSDFGSSKLLSAKRYARDVAADGIYLDPVYHNTGRFTDKSDVYSFGVVLLELITRKKARYGDGDGQILETEFKKACKKHGNGRMMYDAEILSDGDAHYAHRCMECLDMTGALAVRCLNRDDPDERPKMAEVVEELQQAKKLITGR